MKTSWKVGRAALALCVMTCVVGCADGGIFGGSGGDDDIRVDTRPDTGDAPDAGDLSDAGEDAGLDDAGNLPDADDEPDADTDTDAEPDTNVEPELTCADILDTASTWTLPLVGQAQLQARAAFDGEGVWVTYTQRPGASGTPERVYAAKMGCDAELLVEPFEVSTSPDARSLQPSLALSDTTLFVVWSEDDLEGTVRARAFDLDGTPRQAESFAVTPILSSGDAINTIWQPDVAVLDDNEAILAASALTSEGARLVLQRFDANGNRLLDGFFPYPVDTYGEQTDPSVAANESRLITMSFVGGGFDTPRVYHGQILAGETKATPAQAIVAHPTIDLNRGGRLSKGQNNGRHWLAYSGGVGFGNDIIVKDGSRMSAGSDTASSAVSNREALLGDVAASPTGGAVAWITRRSSGTALNVHARRFLANASGDFTSQAGRVDLHTGDQARMPYGVSIDHVEGSVYVVLWGQGDAPNTQRVQGRFVNLN